MSDYVARCQMPDTFEFAKRGGITQNTKTSAAKDKLYIMSFHFSNIITMLSRRFIKKYVPEEAKTKKKKKSTKAAPMTTTTTKEDVEGPLSLSTSSSRNSNTETSSDRATVATTTAAVVSVESLPYAQYVTLSPEEMKFNCQVRVMAHEVKFSIVTTVITSWEHDLKVIPGWETIVGELLLRKYVAVVIGICFICQSTSSLVTQSMICSHFSTSSLTV